MWASIQMHLLLVVSLPPMIVRSSYFLLCLPTVSLRVHQHLHAPLVCFLSVPWGCMEFMSLSLAQPPNTSSAVVPGLCRVLDCQVTVPPPCNSPSSLGFLHSTLSRLHYSCHSCYSCSLHGTLEFFPRRQGTSLLSPLPTTFLLYLTLSSAM